MADGDRYEDGALAAKARAGDEQAFAELFSRYKGVVRSVSNGFFLPAATARICSRRGCSDFTRR